MVTQTVEEAPTLYPEIREAPAPPGRGKHGYYRKPNGWISTGPTTPANRSGYEYKGFTFLPQYGEFKNDAKGTEYREFDARGVGWDPTVEPWRLIFQKGGAKEFPVSQIIAFRWHIRPPYKEVTFPQMEGVSVTDLPCPECQAVFSSTSETEAASFLRIHLTSGINRRHDYTVRDLTDLGREWGLDFETRRIGRMRRPEAPTLEPEPQQAPALTPGELVVVPPPTSRYACADCGWTPPASTKHKYQSLRTHRTRNHAGNGA